MKEGTNPLTGARRFVNRSQFGAFTVLITGDVEALPVTVAGVPAFLTFFFNWERHCLLSLRIFFNLPHSLTGYLLNNRTLECQNNR